MRSVPTPRGETSAALAAALAGPPGELDVPLPSAADPVLDDDLQVALTLCYELHYQGLPGVDERWEWHPALLALRAALEAPFERRLRELAAPLLPDPAQVRAEEADLALRAVLAADDGPSLSTHLQRDGTRAQFEETVVHRSIYQLKEADPHTFAIPRLHGGPKAALVEIQADEYGGGRPERVHSRLFADLMDELDLDPAYGAYVDLVPAISLATVNAMSLFGLHRRLRGAIVGHLAAVEIGSAVPSRRYGDGLRRLGLGSPRAVRFYDEHVEADAVHEQVAAVDMAGGLIGQEPALAGDVLFGAAALVALDAVLARHLLGAWADGRSSLRAPLRERDRPPVAAAA